MFGAANGKGKGKGKERGPRREGGQGHMLPKTRLSEEKFTGTVVTWRGKYGWIKPAEEIEHEKAHLHSGDLFVAMDGLEGVESLEEGAPVEFHIFEDESGLGAEEVEVMGPGKPTPKGKGKGAPFAAGAAKGAGKFWGMPMAMMGKGAAAWGGPAAGYGGKAAGKAAWGGQMTIRPLAGKGADKGKAKGKGKDGEVTKSGAPRGQGHTLPRTRITVEKFTGTVKAWKGKYGWIVPAEEIEHEKAKKNNGSIWVSKNDIEGAESLEQDATVEFHIWEDSTGLGAEEVVVV